MADEPLTLNDATASSAATEDTTQAGSAEDAGLSSAAAELGTPTEGAPRQNGAGSTPAAKGAETKADTADELPPFHTHPRWVAVQQERDQLKQERERLAQEVEQRKAWDPIVEQFKANGLSDAQAVQAAFERQTETAVLRNVALDLKSQVDAGVMTPEQAEERFARIQIERAANKQQTQSQQQTSQVSTELRELRLERQIPQLLTEFPEMDAEDVKERALANPNADVQALAKKSHENAMKTIARYNAKTAKRPAATESPNGSPTATTKSVEEMSPEEFNRWFDSQVSKAERAKT